MGFAFFFLNLLVKSEHMCTISDVHMEDVG